MKKIIALLLALITGNIISQNINYELRGNYKNAIHKEKIDKAKTMADLISGYPSGWILGYVSVELTVTNNGKKNIVKSKNDVLTEEQLSLLRNACLYNELAINIQYKSKNSVTNEVEINNMKYTATLIPEVEAEFYDGKVEMSNYIKTNLINKIPELKNKSAKVYFTVNESGEIINTKITQTTGNTKLDNLIIEAINNMPKWKPAINAKGLKVKQEFVFNVGNFGAC